MNDDDKPITNRSLHGVAGEAACLKTIECNDNNSTGSVPDCPVRPKTWLDGVFNSIPKPVLNRQVSNTQLQSLSDQENHDTKQNRSGSRNNSQLATLQDKIQQQQEELEKLRQNSALYQRLNSELKASTANASDRAFQEKIEELVKEVAFEQTEKFQLLRKITELNLRVDELDEKLENERSLVDNNEDVDKRFVSLSRELTETQQELHMSQRAVIRLQKEQDAMGSIYDKRFHEAQTVVNKEREQLQNERSKLEVENEKVREQFRKLQDHETNKAEWHRQLYQKDETIKQLKSQISRLNVSLDSVKKDQDVSRTQSESVEQYLQDEVHDLRLLNDGQEQEIQRLRIELEMALNDQANSAQKIRCLQEIQEQEITRLRNELDKCHSERDVIQQKVAELQTSTEKFRGLQESQEQEIMRLRDENEKCRNERDIIDQKVEELQISIAQFHSQATQGTDNEEISRKSELIAIESSLTIGKLVACRDRIGAALQDIESRDSESLTTDKKRSKEAEILLEQSNFAIDGLETELSESRRVIDNLYVQIKECKHDYESKIDGLYSKINSLSADRVTLKNKVSELNNKIKALTEERDLLRESTSDEPNQSDSRQSLLTQQTIEEMEKKNQVLQRSLLEVKLNLAAVEEQKARLQEDYDHRFASKHEEKKVEDYGDQTGERTIDRSMSSTAARDCSILMDEIERLNKQILIMRQQQDKRTLRPVPIQSTGSLEEDLRKELESARNKEKVLSSQLQQLKEGNADIQERDKSISTLVKSTVALERRLECARIEIDILRTRLAKEIGADQVKLVVGDSMSLDELKHLRELITKTKKIEESFHAKIDRLKREVKKAQGTTSEHVASLRSETNNAGKSPVQNTALEQQVKERDAAISKLVKQSMAQDKLITELKKERQTTELTIQTLTSSFEKAPTLDEVNQLRQEAEVFAGQVIELDDEIQTLKTKMSEQVLRIAELEKELVIAKEERSPEVTNTVVIKSYEAEIDELKEANAEQLEELRLLRKKARDVEASVEAIAKAKSETAEIRNEALAYQRRVDELTRERASILIDAETNAKKIVEMEERVQREIEEKQQRSQELVRSLQGELSNANAVIQQLKTSPCFMDEMEFDCMKSDLSAMRSTIEQQTQELKSARLTIQELESMLAEKTAAQASAYEEEKEELIAEAESLSQQLQEATRQLKQFEEDRSLIQEFKKKLEIADDAREEAEKTLIESYERKITIVTQDKDATIDKLHNKLFDENNLHLEEKGELTEQIREYEAKISDLNDKLESQVKEKDTRIYVLERTLEAQEQLLGNMKTEMDQLQSGMETSAARRREEIDELQQEILALTSTNSKMDRDIKSLQLELEASRLTHNDEVVKLRDTISRYEQQNNPEHRTAADLQMEIRIKEVKDRLEKLKWRNTSLKEENEYLRERLEIAEVDAVENRRQVAQIAELRETVSKQSILIDDLQAELNDDREFCESEISPTKTLSLENTTKGIDCDPTSSVVQVRPPLPLPASAPNTPKSIGIKKPEKVQDSPVALSLSNHKRIERKNSAPSPKRGRIFLGRKQSYDGK